MRIVEIGPNVLSLAVIAKNESDRIERCIRSVPIADEVLVLDSGSSDGTAAVARALGAVVHQTDWPGHVAQKNRALARARGDWVLSLDADEWLSEAAVSELSRFLLEPGDAAGASFPRLSHWLGKPIRHGRWYPDRKVRVVKRGMGTWGGIDPHDQLHIDGKVVALGGDIEHVPYRSFSEHIQTIDRYSATASLELEKRGRRGRRRDIVVRPAAHFVSAFLIRRGFLDGVEGFALASLGATYTLSKWTRLYLATRSA